VIRALLSALLLGLGTSAQADWTVRPSYFRMDTVFATCEQKPNPVPTCATALADGYALRREITYALLPCITRAQTDCTQDLSDAGLPPEAFTEVRALFCSMSEFGLPDHGGPDQASDDRFVPSNHCIEKLARLITARGHATTHNTNIFCGIDWIECGELAQISANHWYQRAHRLTQILIHNHKALSAEQLSALYENHQRIGTARETCASAGTSGGWGEELERMGCETEIFAEVVITLENLLRSTTAPLNRRTP